MGKKLSELIRDNGGGQSYGSGDQGRWQAELAQVAIELMAVSVLSRLSSLSVEESGIFHISAIFLGWSKCSDFIIDHILFYFYRSFSGSTVTFSFLCTFSFLGFLIGHV